VPRDELHRVHWSDSNESSPTPVDIRAGLRFFRLMTQVRPIEPADLPAILALNNAHAREISLIDEGGLARLLASATHAAAIGAVGAPDAFLVAFDQDTPSQGPNHAWFLARLPRFLYVDRVCVEQRARKQGLARALYANAFALARARDLPVVCCEVNIDPPNPASDAFHAALGFHETGRAHLPARNKTVRYLERPLLP
jgi:predicted GNAT superfamily acetyltransferase